MDKRSWFESILETTRNFWGASLHVDAVTQAARSVDRQGPVLVNSPVREAVYYSSREKGRIRCMLCPNHCIILPGQRGRCLTRKNADGKLYTLAYGLTTSTAIPFRNVQFPIVYHCAEGACDIVGLVGCGLRCSFCFAWDKAQSDPLDCTLPVHSPEQILEQAVRNRLRAIVFTTNEPTNNFEFTRDLARIGKQAGLDILISTGGYCNPEPLEELAQHCNGFVFGLKAFSESNYARHTQGSLEPVLKSMQLIKRLRIPLEVQYIVIPTITDSSAELRAMASWIRDNLGPYTALTVNRFYPTFKMKNLPPTPMSTLLNAKKICEEEGLKYVNICLSNVFLNDFLQDNPDWDKTVHCPYCGKVLIQYIFQNGSAEFVNNVEKGACRFCGNPVPGMVGILARA